MYKLNAHCKIILHLETFGLVLVGEDSFSYSKLALTLMVWGGHIVPALFSDACFSLKLKCWRAQIS